MTAGVDWVLAGKADFAELESLYPHNIFLGLLQENSDDPHFWSRIVPNIFTSRGDLSSVRVVRDTLSALLRSPCLDRTELEKWLEFMSSNAKLGAFEASIDPRMVQWNPPMWTIFSHSEIVQLVGLVCMTIRRSHTIAHTGGMSRPFSPLLLLFAYVS
jgi:hypothetical protein